MGHGAGGCGLLREQKGPLKGPDAGVVRSDEAIAEQVQPTRPLHSQDAFPLQPTKELTSLLGLGEIGTDQLDFSADGCMIWMSTMVRWVT